MGTIFSFSLIIVINELHCIVGEISDSSLSGCFNGSLSQLLPNSPVLGQLLGINNVERTVYWLPYLLYRTVLCSLLKLSKGLGNGVSNIKEVSSCCLLSQRGASIIDPIRVSRKV